MPDSSGEKFKGITVNRLYPGHRDYQPEEDDQTAEQSLHRWLDEYAEWLDAVGAKSNPPQYER